MNDCQREGGLASPRNGLPNSLPNAKWPAIKPYIQVRKKDCRLYSSIHVCEVICVTIIKKAIYLRLGGLLGGSMEGAGGKKGKGVVVQLYFN